MGNCFGINSVEPIYLREITSGKRSKTFILKSESTDFSLLNKHFSTSRDPSLWEISLSNESSKAFKNISIGHLEKKKFYNILKLCWFDKKICQSLPND